MQGEKGGASDGAGAGMGMGMTIGGRATGRGIKNHLNNYEGSLKNEKIRNHHPRMPGQGGNDQNDDSNQQ